MMAEGKLSMKCCGRHSSDLLGVIKRKGLSHTVTQDATEVKRRAEAWLAGSTTRENFDAYVVANLEIFQKATDIFMQTGYQLPAVNGSAPCPLCHVMRALRNAEADVKWIDNVTDAVVIFAEANHIPRK